MSEVFTLATLPRAEFAVIGHPIAHSKSPQMHMAALKCAQLDYRYVAVDVEPTQLTRCLNTMQEMGFIGANVTIPYKGAAQRWCDQTDEFSTRVGACNTIRFGDRLGINTDGPGIMKVIESRHPATLSRTPRKALVLGAGGTSAAVLTALSTADWDVSCWNRTFERVGKLFGDIGISGTMIDKLNCTKIDLSEFDLIVNATAAGLEGDRLQLNWRTASSNLFAIDCGYANMPTPFVQSAIQHGVQAIDGREMLVEQGALAFTFWLGTEPDRAKMREAIAWETTGP